MTDQVIIYNNPKTGRMSVFIPAVEGRLNGESEGEWLARCQARAVPKGATDVRIVARSELPTDRTFRDAWSIRGGKPSVDMSAAKEIHRKRIRRRRKALFRELDAAYQKADEAGDQEAKRKISAKRQALRDAPAHPGIDAAQTPDQLKATWPL